ncbi:gibberellin-regulated protein 9-like [Mangifera indica]|uniref:gibberellin-regulated protein 9-like n=1 Tax=Mangifera indica TaxID=29780 RepID=UPI001CF9FDC8|nr:gibberellin-regulated protein 9-like [Mangifera indica]
MKLFFFIVVIALLSLQALAEASLFGYNAGKNFASIKRDDEESDVLAAHKKHYSGKINCSNACSSRCKESSRKKICHRACRACCKTCNCVPPGTSGNTKACPCYASLRTHGNKPKCP